MDKVKKLASLFAATIMLLSLLAPMAVIRIASAADPADWYMTVNGVLNTDYYALYPFEKKILRIGLSQFGELISDVTNVGLEYANDRDPFAPIAGTTVPPELSKKVWINGWFIDIRYNHATWGSRCVWAGALFADLTSYGGPWLRVDNNYGSCTYEWQENFRLPGKEIDPATDYRDVKGVLMHGGRKTNGTVITEPIQVLYNGPRLFVAKITNHIYDWYEPTKENRHLVDLVLTVIFNKVKKQVIVIKDVKIAPPAKFEVAPLVITVGGQRVEIENGYLIQLSNREEWDLGTIYPSTTSYSSYVHFYRGEEAQPTVYNEDWTILPTLPSGTSIGGVVINRYGGQPGAVGTYDVAVIISNDRKYVGWHAFWPSVSDWSVTAGSDGTWHRALVSADPHTVDGYNEPWRSPLVVGEWDFVLSDQRRPYPHVNVVADVQFRAVSVYGVTDLNDGKDAAFAGINLIDREVMYQLDEVFNPWNLYNAVEKWTWRWVEFFAGDGTKTMFKLSNRQFVGRGLGEWYEYCSFSERVLLDGQLIYPVDALISDAGAWTCFPSFPYAYYYYYDNEGYAWIVFLKDADGSRATAWDFELWAPPRGAVIKVLYSTYAPPDAPVFGGRYEWVIVGRDAHTVDSAGAAMVAAAFKDKLLEYYGEGGGAYIGLAGADMMETVVYNAMPWVMRRFGTGNTKADYKDAIGRAALKDDWCKTWPVASSNIIGVGGPLANMLAYYANDFTSAIFGLEEYAASIWDNKIIPLPCWDMTKTRVYASSETKGYAVVATYKDINGTVLFLIWGHWGRDTYYACKWFHEEGIYQLQSPCFKGVTSIILEIDYTKHPPKVSVVEVLGTISERQIMEGNIIKGGIHDP